MNEKEVEMDHTRTQTAGGLVCGNQNASRNVICNDACITFKGQVIIEKENTLCVVPRQ